MKITHSIVLSAILTASVFYAKPSVAYDKCSSSSTLSIPTQDSISVGNRTRQALWYLTVYTNQGALLACNLTENLTYKIAIPDDGSLSSVEMSLYTNGQQKRVVRLRRGTIFTIRLSPERVQDYRIEFNNIESSNGIGNIYFLQ